MNEKELKLSFIKRYRYLFLNAPIVLGDYLAKPKPAMATKSISNFPDILTFLLGEHSLEDTKFYQALRVYKHQDDFQKVLKRNLNLLRETSVYYDETFSLWTVLSLSRDWLIKNMPKTVTRRQALQTLDEYFRVLRYNNDGKNYQSGYYLELEDNENDDFYYLNLKSSERVEYQLDKTYSKESPSKFIYFFSKTENNGAPKQGYNFTDSEIEKIYISLHDELPFNLFTECSFDEVDTTLERPNNTRPCHFQFRISEENIFTDNLGNFYQLCPNCGYITLIDETLIPDSIQDRIIARCKMNPDMGKINFITSEITNIEFRSNCRTRILTNNHVINNP